MISAKRTNVRCFINQGKFLAATHQHEAVARKIRVSALARNDEANNYDVQMQVRQLDQEADRENCFIDFPKKQTKLLRISDKNWKRKKHQKCGLEMSKFTTDAQNWVFKHNSRKTFRNNKIQKMLDYIST